ncbi:MAG TPA: DUF2339 domain-containing protein [Herpetosiphonaceae bacterium]
MEALIPVLIIVVAVYIFRTHQLEGKVDSLEQQLDRLASAARRTLPTLAPAPPPVVTPVLEQTSIPTPPPLPVAQRPPVAVRAETFVAPQPPAAPVPPQQASRSREEWELLVGGQFLNRIGAFALILGVGFFLKYAFDNNWINETMRVLIGLLAGAGLLAGGERARHKGLPIFAHGLVGAGLAILYLAVYAAYNFYQLVPQPVALGAMSLVTILAFIQALRYNALSISLLGWAGGFLTPFLLASDQASAVGLFAYILLLDLGLLAVVFKRDSWVVLELLTRGATYVVYGTWYISSYTSAEFGVAVLFLSLFWALFFLLHVAHVLRKGTDYIELRHLGAAVNTLVFYAALYSLVNPLYPGWMAGVTLLLGAIYAGTALVLMRRRPDATVVHAQYMLTAIGALVLATALQFDSSLTLIAWSLEALALLWCAERWKLGYVRYAALSIFPLAVGQLLIMPSTYGYNPIDMFTPLLNQRALAWSILVLTLAVSTRLFRDQTQQSNRDLSASLHLAWSVLLLGLLTVETNDVFRLLLNSAPFDQVAHLRYMRWLAIGVLWMAFSLPLIWGGTKTTAQSLAYVGVGAGLMAVVLVALVGLFFAPITQFQLLLNVRVAAFMLVIAGLWLYVRLFGKQPEWRLPQLWYTLIALLIFELITVETNDVFEHAMSTMGLFPSNEAAWEAGNRLENLQQLAISSVWLAYASVLIGLGFWRRVPALRLGAILLAGITILKIFVYDLAFLEPLYRIFSFIGLGLILLGVSYLYQRYKALIFGTPVAPTA